MSLGFCRNFKVLELTPNLEYLNMINCSRDFNLDAVATMSHLKVLTIRDSCLSELHHDQFAQIPDLEALDLKGNAIETMINGTFQQLQQLVNLELADNSIKFLPKGIFYPLQKLENLDLSSNQISIITADAFSRNIKLNLLRLNGNPLINVDFPIGLPKLRFNFLDLSGCGQLENIELYVEVDMLILDNCGVKRLLSNKSIRRLRAANSNLTHVDLQGAQLDGIFLSEILCDLRTLEWIDLSNTSIETSHVSASNFVHRRCPLSNIRFLNLSRNQLDSLPLESPLFGPSLIFLDLSHNKLENISMEPLKSQNLQSLRLEGNNLTRFYYRYLYDWHRNLKELALYDNKFSSSFYNEINE
ncbi:protein flightless-1 homolog [Drosophila serrata]|uniref:protein flightless-1 homolog n=1 Tax=Drosophila serrata TaxID=7274 RepID=UPI000A1D0E93|nr:protein flightless-1 homolog [Drosophila serrata]